MDVKMLFRGISTKLLVDFEVSAGINHQGSKGTFRESALREFLADSRLPQKFGLGAGEIVSSFGGVSKQSDLIVYDRLESIPLLFGNSVQVFPIESVFGIVEVKSRLSKVELLAALENIKSVKDLVVDGAQPLSDGLRRPQSLPRPFGIVFAYGLAGNSIESLTENLRVWEKVNPKKFWPNIIAVLGEGVIVHFADGGAKCFKNQELENAEFVVGLNHQEDSFYYFYSTLLTLITSVKLPSFSLDKYFSPSQRIADNIIHGHTGFKMSGSEKTYRFSDELIGKILAACAKDSPLTYRDILEQRFGGVPPDIPDNQLTSPMFLYNPENLPAGSFGQLSESQDGHSSKKTLLAMHTIIIDGSAYAVAMDSLGDNDFEEVP